MFIIWIEKQATATSSRRPRSGFYALANVVSPRINKAFKFTSREDAEKAIATMYQRSLKAATILAVQA